MNGKDAWFGFLAITSATVAVLVAVFPPKENSLSAVMAFGLSSITYALLSKR